MSGDRKTVQLNIPTTAEERIDAQGDWKCCGCAARSPNRVRSCDCATDVIWRSAQDKSRPDYAWKVEAVEANTARAVETLSSWMLSQGYATGQGDSVEGLLGELGGQIDERIDRYRKLLGAVELRAVANEAELTRLRENSASVWKIAQNEIAALRADALNDLAYAHGAHAALAAMHGGMPEAEFLAQIEKRSKEPRAELTRIREENIELRNSHAAVVQEAYERLSAQRNDIARKDEALREVQSAILAGFEVLTGRDAQRMNTVWPIITAALHPLAPGSKGDAS